MEITYNVARNRRRVMSDGSSDSLRNGGPSIARTIVGGLRRASPGAKFVAATCIVLAIVAMFAHS